MSMEPLYEGKAKRLYTTDDPNVLRMEYKDEATAFNAEKKAEFENKGRLNTAITLAMYRMLEAKGVETHLLESIDDTNLLVKSVDILMVEVIVRNIAAGSFSKRLGVKEGTPFNQPIVEFSYKSDELGDPLINDDYAREMGLATPEECAELKSKALIINDVMIEFFQHAGLKLVDFKVEFGRTKDADAKIVLADEISPDTCRLWDLETGKKMDKDRFRQDLGGVMEAYEEVLKRVEAAVK
jgi:phosphoribosylaminoimidazole-succinocarboxamide synthase